MARPPDGRLPQAASRTALLAYLAGRFDGVLARHQDAFYRGIGVRVGRAGAEAAAERHRHETGAKLRPGPKPTRVEYTAAGTRRPAFRDWLWVEETKLGLDIALVRLTGNGRSPVDLKQHLAGIAGVRQIVDLAARRDLVVVVVFHGREDRQRLRAQLEELDRDLTWEDAEDETWDPTRQTWRALARRAAREEHLLVR